MMTQAIAFVLEAVFGLFVLAALTRFYAQAFRAPFRNPIGEFVMALTDFAVKPLRRVVPGALGLDLSSMLVAWIAELLLIVLLAGLGGMETLAAPHFWSSLLALSLLRLLKYSLYLLIGVVIVEALMSLLAPIHPLRSFFGALCRPFLRPLRRIIPLIGNVDLSPWVLLIVVQLILLLPLAALEHAALQHLPPLLGR